MQAIRVARNLLLFSLLTLFAFAQTEQKTKSDANSDREKIKSQVFNKPYVQPKTSLKNGNIRINVLYPPLMAFSGVRLALKAEADQNLASRFSLGLSVEYFRFGSLSVGDIRKTKDLPFSGHKAFLFLGLIANGYLLGDIQTGGLIFRPHMYWVHIRQEKNFLTQLENPLRRDGFVQNGLSVGTEILYQWIINEIIPTQPTHGLLFEAGAGITYYALPRADYRPLVLSNEQGSIRIMPKVVANFGYSF